MQPTESTRKGVQEMKSVLWLAVPVLLAGCSSITTPATAAPRSISPLEVSLSISRYRQASSPTLSMLGKPTPLELVEAPTENGCWSVMTGEPIILNARLTNNSAETLTLDLGNDLHPWLVLSLRDQKGIAVRRIPRHRVVNYLDGLRAASLHGKHLISLAPGSDYVEPLVVTQQFALRSAGRYELAVQTNVPWYRGSLDYSAALKTQPTEIASDRQTLSLAASVAGLRPLEVLAELLWQQIEAEPRGQDLAIKSLFAMPESAAFPVWEKVCDSSIAASNTIDELERLCTPTAAELLGRMAANRAKLSEERHVAYGILHGMYQRRNEIGDPALEAVVVRLLRQLDRTLPPLDTLTTPGNG